MFATRRSRIALLACDGAQRQGSVFSPVPGPQQLDYQQHGEQMLYRHEVKVESARGGVQCRMSNTRMNNG
jgi:hypothetical protein